MKKALITGSSRGIGRAIAIELAKDGFEIVILYAGNEAKAKEVKDIIENDGGVATIVQADLSDINQTATVIEKVGGVDVLVLNASIQYKNKWDNITVDECYTQLNCNFVSSFLLIQGVAPFMMKNKWGRIITIGSVQEAKPHPDMLIYSASKAAQTNMVQSLSLQLAPHVITVNNIAPGVIATDRNVESLSNEEYAKTVRESIPLNFYGLPEDCSGMVSLLCSEKGRYITGQSIYIDGGKSVK